MTISENNDDSQAGRQLGKQRRRNTQNINAFCVFRQRQAGSQLKVNFVVET